MNNLNLLLDRDLFSCPICCNEFNIQSYPPICISCGHTLCKGCIERLSVSNSITCPIDKKKILVTKLNSSVKTQFDNNILIKLLRIIDHYYIDTKQLCEYSFYYCEKCDIFISNKVKDVHVTACHKVVTFYLHRLRTIDYYKNIIDDYSLSDNIKDKLGIFVVLHYLYNPKIMKNYSVNDVSIFHNEHYFENNYSFLGHKLMNIYDENKYDEFFAVTKFVFEMLIAETDSEIITDNGKNPVIKEKKKIVFKNGIFISKNKEVINGIFLTEGGNLLKAALGIFKDDSTIFFGFLKLQLNTNGYEIKLKYGILLQDTTFYFGKFNGDDIYPLYTHLVGEEVNLLTNQCIRRFLDHTLSKTVNIEESITHNSFFSLQSNLLSVNKIIYDDVLNSDIPYTLCFHSENRIYEERNSMIISDNKDVDVLQFSNIKFNQITIKYLNKGIEEKNEFRIDPIISDKLSNTNFMELKFGETYLTFLKPFANLSSLKFLENYSFIISPNFLALKSKFKYSGYFFQLRMEHIEALEKNEIKSLPIKNFFNLKMLKLKELFANFEYFINTMVGFLLESPSFFNVTYQDFMTENDEKIEPCFNIDCLEGKVTLNDPIFVPNKVQANDNLKSIKIYQLFPNIYQKHLEEFFASLNESNGNKGLDVQTNNPKMTQVTSRSIIQPLNNETNNIPLLHKFGNQNNSINNISDPYQNKKKKTNCKCYIY